MSQKQSDKPQKFTLKILIAACALAFTTTMQVRADDAPSPRPSREAFHTAMEACISENNLTKPAPGVRPSEADRKVVDACLVTKGFSKPEGGGHHHGGPRPPAGDESPDDAAPSASGVVN